MWNYVKNNKSKVMVTFLCIFLFYPKLAAMLLLILLVNLPIRSILKKGKKMLETLTKILEAEH